MVKLKARLAWELAVKATELVIRTRHILVPKSVVLIIVPLPQPGPILEAILMHPLGVPVTQEIAVGFSKSTSSEEPAMIATVMVPPLTIPLFTNIPV